MVCGQPKEPRLLSPRPLCLSSVCMRSPGGLLEEKRTAPWHPSALLLKTFPRLPWLSEEGPKSFPRMTSCVWWVLPPLQPHLALPFLPAPSMSSSFRRPKAPGRPTPSASESVSKLVLLSGLLRSKPLHISPQLTPAHPSDLGSHLRLLTKAFPDLPDQSRSLRQMATEALDLALHAAQLGSWFHTHGLT